MELLIGEIPDARREPETQPVASSEHLVRETLGVREVLLYVQIGLVVEEAVKYMGSVADSGVDHLDIERGVLVGDVSVEGQPGLAAIMA